MTDAELIAGAVKADATLGGLLKGDKIYPVVLPPNVKDPVSGAVVSPILPALTYMLVSQPTEWTQERAQYRWPRWRFTIWSLVYDDLIPIATALASLFGSLDTSPLSSSRIEYPASQVEGHEEATNRYWRRMDTVAYMPAGAISQ